MAKPKHPSKKTLRAGQSIYLLSMRCLTREIEYFAYPIRVMHDSYPAPAEGYVVDAAPMWWLKERLWNGFNMKSFYSKRQAASFARRSTIEECAK